MKKHHNPPPSPSLTNLPSPLLVSDQTYQRQCSSRPTPPQTADLGWSGGGGNEIISGERWLWKESGSVMEVMVGGGCGMKVEV